MSLNLNPLLVDLQTLLETNSASVKVYREESVPVTCDPNAGYLAWNFDVNHFDKCSVKYTNQVYADFEVVIYARERPVRSTLIDSMLDILAPESAGDRDDFAPTALASTFIHYCTLFDQFEVFTEKTGHGSPDVPGISYSFNIKASL